MYLENPKTKGSGIKCVIPQKDICPRKCADCFFQGGRSYLEPLSENLPNIPSPEEGVVYRINDGNDSSVGIEEVLEVSQRFPMRFYNTSFVEKLHRFDAPVVLTVNPGEMTDKEFFKSAAPNLMFVRFRVNTWNFRGLGVETIMWYAERKIPVVLTFMAYQDVFSIPLLHREKYEQRKRTLNEYWQIKPEYWKDMMDKVKGSRFARWVDSCGTAEEHDCKFCGNCLKHYFRKRRESCE